jgi:hypothetical protein
MVRLLNNFTRLCKTEDVDELCSCDYRINIYECSHSEFYVTTNKVLVAMCILVIIMAGGSLYYLMKVKKQPFFLPATRERGWLRTKPLHSYHLIVITWMSCKFITKSEIFFKKKMLTNKFLFFSRSNSFDSINK